MESSALRVLLVEDDEFQAQVLSAMIADIGRTELGSHGVPTVELAVASSGTEALDNLHGVNLVLLDYMLPGGDADTVLPAIREKVGALAAIIILSGPAQEAHLQHCWLDLGADSYRLKPVSLPTMQELFCYTLQKRRYLQKRKREADDPVAAGTSGKAGRAGLTPSPRAASPEAPEGAKGEMRDTGGSPSGEEPYVEAPGFMSLLSTGRRGAVRLGFADGVPVAIKTMDATLARGPPPPPHPYVNRVLRTLTVGGQLVEIRELCDDGELFSALLVDDLLDGDLPPVDALRWLEMMAEGAAHCHAHGAVHGQLHAENLLLHSRGLLQLTGFSCCAPSPAFTDGAAPQVALRPFDATLDAPELGGRAVAAAHELFACDVWSLGVLFVWMLTGQPDASSRDDSTDAAALFATLDEMHITPPPSCVASSRGGATPSPTPSPTPAAGSGADDAAAAVAAAAHRNGSAVAIDGKALSGLVAAMLQAQPARRPTAEQLCAAVKRLLGEHSVHKRPLVPPSQGP